MSKRRHNFGTKRFKENSLFTFHARIALKSLILLFVRLIARGAGIGKTHTQTDRHTDRTSTVTLAHARRGLTKDNMVYMQLYNCALGPKWIPESTEGLKGIMCLVLGIMRQDCLRSALKFLGALIRRVTLLMSVSGLIADCMAQKKKKIHTICFFIQPR